jgi:hypothetical protein
MPIIIENVEEKQTHHTLFGFDTKNGFASKSLNFIYIIVMVVAMAFAYHALSLVLSDWNPGLVFLAALSVVGLPYCIKIIMYGREVFEYKYAVLCVLISILPTIFDFVGLYSETSIKSSLQSTKFQVLEKVSYFDKEARKTLNKEMLAVENDSNKKTTTIEQTFNSKITELIEKNNNVSSEAEKQFNNQLKQLNDKVNLAQQALIDETKGVKGKTTSGVPGVGPRTVELEADLRKAQAAVDLEKSTLEKNKLQEIEKIKTNIELQQKELNDNKNKEISLVQAEKEKKLSSLQQGLKSIDDLMSTTEDNRGLIFDVNKATSFAELADVSIKLNSAINVVSSKLNVEPKYVKFDVDNVINLSFSALLRGDITALICFLLAFLLEIVDTIIVYMVRGVKNKPQKKFQEPINKIKETIKYDF